jgi:uncharacterized protein (DUF885 family)
MHWQGRCHDAVLRGGAMPLEALTREVEDWAATG